MPGMLRHANHPNSRSLIVFPGRPEAGAKGEPRPAERPAEPFDRIRIVSITSNNGNIGAVGNGMDLNEAATLALRLSQMNTTRGGQGINLDGGQSTQLLVLNKTLGPFRKKSLRVTSTPVAVAANYVVFTRQPEKENKPSTVAGAARLNASRN